MRQGVQGWRSGESTRLPTLWGRSDMWVEFVVGSPLALRGFSPGTLALKTNTSKFQLDLERMDTFQRVLKNS